jgi:hypothetical protein
MNVHASVYASVTHNMINHKYWPILIYDNSHITGIILEHVDQFYKGMNGRLRSIVGHAPELMSRYTFLCTENTQAIGFSLANYGLYRQSIYIAQHIYWTGGRKKGVFCWKFLWVYHGIWEPQNVWALFSFLNLGTIGMAEWYSVVTFVR